MDNSELTENQISALTQLAANPKAGDKFTFGGKAFTRQFMTIDAEAELVELVLAVIKRAPESTLEESLRGAVAELKQALSIILADQYEECTLDWVSTVRGADVNMNNMIKIVLGQMLLNDMGALLGKVLALGAIANSLQPKAPMKKPMKQGQAIFLNP